jgi:hypothetical protein
MQTTIITEIQLTAIVVALVAAFRDQFPAINGKVYVFGVATLIGEALCFLVGGDSVRNIIQHGIVIAMTAAGGMQVVGYHADKVAAAAAIPVTVDCAAPLPPPSKVPSLGPQRGLARASAMLWAGPLSLLAVGALLLACASVQKRDVKSVVDIVKSLVEEVCSPDDPSLDACIDKLLSSPRVKAARAAAHRSELDGGK